jgi:hypothetical protein
MFARVITAQAGAEGFDGAIRLAEQQLPGARQNPGFKGYYLLTDAETGKLVIISLWETRDVSDPAAVRRRRAEVPCQQVSGPLPGHGGHRGAGLAAPAEAPAMPRSRISRATVHRAAAMLSRCSCRQTFRAPYTRRPFVRSSHTRMISFFSHSSRCSRGDRSRSRFFAA